MPGRWKNTTRHGCVVDQLRLERAHPGIHDVTREDGVYLIDIATLETLVDGLNQQGVKAFFRSDAGEDIK